MIFETARFRVHTTTRSAWVEVREPGGLVLREQRAIPVTAAWLSDATEASPLRDALIDFESARRGDRSLREALTGVRETKLLVPNKNRAQPPRPKFLARPPVPKKQIAWRQPLRPPLKASPQ